MKNFLTAMSASDHIAGYFAVFRKGFSEAMYEEMREERSQPQEVSVKAFERENLALGSQLTTPAAQISHTFLSLQLFIQCIHLSRKTRSNMQWTIYKLVQLIKQN